MCTLKQVKVYTGVYYKSNPYLFNKPRVAVTDIDCSRGSWLNKFTHLISNQFTKLPNSELRKSRS